MGINYYWQPACSVCGCDHQRPNTEHIGKASYGWVFSFHATDEVRSAAEWREVLASGGRIFDECGTTLTPEEFWNLVESKKNGPHHHAREYPQYSFFGPEGESMSEGEFS